MTPPSIVAGSAPDQVLPATTDPTAGTHLGEGCVPAVGLIPLCNRAGEPVAFALVDAADLPVLLQWRWSFDYRGYAMRVVQVDGKQRSIRMHRQVLDALDEVRDVDHINRNRLDNRRTNLRLTTRAENLANRSPIQDALPQSGVRGVRWDAKQNRWAAFVGRRRVGSYPTVDEAVDAIQARLEVAS